MIGSPRRIQTYADVLNPPAKQLEGSSSPLTVTILSVTKLGLSTIAFRDHAGVGRGLSHLQRIALLVAASSHFFGRKREDRFTVGLEPDQPLDAYLWEVLEWGYGWDPQVRDADSTKFDKRAIGEKEYQAARASVSRAVKRLEDRGLVERYRIAYSAGFNLTEKGIELVTTADIESWF